VENDSIKINPIYTLLPSRFLTAEHRGSQRHTRPLHYLATNCSLSFLSLQKHTEEVSHDDRLNETTITH